MEYALVHVCHILSYTVRMLREELQHLQEQGSYVGEVVKPMDKKKVGFLPSLWCGISLCVVKVWKNVDTMHVLCFGAWENTSNGYLMSLQSLWSLKKKGLLPLRDYLPEILLRDIRIKLLFYYIMLAGTSQSASRRKICCGLGQKYWYEWCGCQCQSCTQKWQLYSTQNITQ